MHAPAKAQRLLDGIVISNAETSRALSIGDEPDLQLERVVRVKPTAPLLRCGDIARLGYVHYENLVDYNLWLIPKYFTKTIISRNLAPDPKNARNIVEKITLRNSPSSA